MNNREIKFRAWDEKKRFLHSPRTLSELMSGGLYWEGKNVMQFTGLKDKNGKEIYEGDILRWGNNELYEVIWENGGFHTKWNMGNGRYDIESLYSVEDFEIIGNVFENPELLK